MRVRTIAERAAAYGMEGLRVDGMDCEAVRQAVSDALNSVRSNGRPVLLEAECYRFCGHSKSDRLVYRTREEEGEWRERDPIDQHRRRLADGGVPEEELGRIEDLARRIVTDACEDAQAAPAPDAAQVLTNPYAG
jgi:pyruvate dehydrogenase E1 component alpha subunit